MRQQRLYARTRVKRMLAMRSRAFKPAYARRYTRLRGEAEAQGVVCARTRDLQVSLPVLYVGLLQYFGEFCTEIPERTV